VSESNKSGPGASAGRFAKVAGLDYKKGAVDYPARLDQDNRHHLFTKPFYDLDIRRKRFEGDGIDEDTRRHFCDFANIAFELALPIESRILDLGCGPGWLVEYLARFGYDVTGVDISPALIEIARERLGRVPYAVSPGKDLKYRFIAHDIEAAPLNEKFDVVLSYDALHHFEDERVVLRNVSSMLNHGGIFMIVEGDKPHDNSETAAELNRVMSEFETLESPFDREYLLELLDEHGFLVTGDYAAVSGLFDRAEVLSGSFVPPAPSYHYLLCKKVSTSQASKVPTSPKPSRISAEFSLLEFRIDHDQAPGILHMEFDVENTGDTVWLTSRIARKGIVRFGLKILDSAGRILEEAHGTPQLLRAVAPGEKRAFILRHSMRGAPGRYTLKLDLLVQDTCWFEQHGTTPLIHEFEVNTQHD
jgi:SAM-dependent methyltransferase